MKGLFLAALTLLASVSCSAGGGTKQTDEETVTNNTTDMKEKGKALVIFFSHAGENYSVGHIEVGNTKIVADYISEMTGADQFEIVAEKSYDMPYNRLIEVARNEERNGELPAYKGQVPDLAQYDTIFIGGPIWWGTYPRVMFTFFGENDLNGKTIIPFTTHEGSGLGNVVSDVKNAYPKATITGQFSIAGHNVRSGKATVQRWLNGLGY